MTRLSSNPIRLFRERTLETAANTYTSDEIDLPVQVIGTNTIHGTEFMWLDVYMSNPSPEAGQSNLVQMQITKDPETAMIERDDENFLWGAEQSANNVGTSGMAVHTHPKQIMTADTRGRGTLLAEDKIHHAVAGIGNSAADRATTIGYGYIVKLSGKDAIQLLLEEDD